MKKFLVVFDRGRLSDSALNYAVQLAKIANAHLVGVFLNAATFSGLRKVKEMAAEHLFSDADEDPQVREKEKMEEADHIFQQTCGEAGIHYSIHYDKGLALLDLKKETMFADLVVVNKYETFTGAAHAPSLRFIKELLTDVQCPVIAVPSRYKTIEKILMLYDGAPASIHAIKMFGYLFGDMKVPVELFTVKDEDMSATRVPENKLIREFTKRHFPHAQYTVVKGNVEEQVVGYLKNHRENELVVLGASHRSEFSRWFKRSMAEILMQKTEIPLFITHS